MKLSTKLISVLLALVLAVASVPVAFALDAGTVYYVDASGGNDDASGVSERSAWRTIAKASSMTYSPGDKILFKAGDYFEGAFLAQGSGTAEAPITVSSYGDIKKLGKPAITVQGVNNLFTIHNVSGWTIENLDLSAPDGRGVFITADQMITSDITVRNCDMHNIWYHSTEYAQGHNACVFISATGLNTRVDRVTLQNITMRDSAYGIHTGAGNAIEWYPQYYVSPEVSYGQDYLFESITMTNLLYDGIAICSVNNTVIRNCALIRTSLNTEYYTAPLWMHHANNVLVENCEVAGATNYKDGMTVDFDGWTTNSTYQYIYSHDNIRFMQNCVYDNTTKNENCTVRYCLSVNDNKEPNNIALCNSDFYPDDDSGEYMENFKFYNNTIINGSEFRFQNLRNSIIANNIFDGNLIQRFILIDNGGVRFTGKFTNNCFSGCAAPSSSDNAIKAKPMFTGDDYADINSFRLSSSSPLIGAGIIVEPDMGEHDFFGNPLTDTHNIGCYEGEGIDDGQFITNDINAFYSIINVIGMIVSFIANISFLF